jgi:hypothetical protein
MVAVMRTSRRVFLAGVPGAGLSAFAAAAPQFPATAPERTLFPQPADGAEAPINPPGFGWWRAPGASAYRLIIRSAGGATVYESAPLKDPVHLPDRTLAPGDYTWDVEALDAAGKAVARRGAWKLRVPKGLVEMPWSDPKAILARVPNDHPRYVFLKRDLPAVRASLKTTRREAWEHLKTAADRALKLPLPKPPNYDTFEGQNRQRLGYAAYFGDFRRYIDGGMAPLALAYLLSGDERYGLAAKKLFLEVASWGVEGLMSVSSRFGDEPGLSMGRHGPRAYDWLYDLFTPAERELARTVTADRARQILARLKRSDYLAKPEESHAGRLIAYLSEFAIALKGEAPDAHEWLDYSLRGLMTFYPHWGDSDGGWAEGPSYAMAYNTIYLGALESLRAAAGLDLYRRPFFGRVRRYFFYCISPVGEIKPFGDGAERGGAGSGGSSLMLHHGRRFRDASAVWYAQQVPDATGVGDGLIPLATEDTVKAAPPSTAPQAAVFRGIGWAALHSAIERPREDTFFLFKSSPFGSVSHSHADQNSFAVLKGGRALAIASGYYGPSYGQPHHALWTRQTKANNSILVDGKGQEVRSAAANGRIARFDHKRALTYVCGDAAAAYGGRLKGFLRHVLFLRPGAFVVLDELSAPAPAEFEWLLHAFEKMQADEAAGTVASLRQGASMRVKLSCPQGLRFTQTDQFETPYNQESPPEYQKKVENQWHFTASTKERATSTRIAAVMLVEGPGEKIACEWKTSGGRTGIAVETAAGKGEVWARLSGAGPKLEGVWRPARGPEERLTIDGGR